MFVRISAPHPGSRQPPNKIIQQRVKFMPSHSAAGSIKVQALLDSLRQSCHDAGRTCTILCHVQNAMHDGIQLGNRFRRLWPSHSRFPAGGSWCSAALLNESRKSSVSAKPPPRAPAESPAGNRRGRRASSGMHSCRIHGTPP